MTRRLAYIVALLLVVTAGCGSCFGPSPDGNSADGWFAVGPRVIIAAGTTLDVIILDAHQATNILTETEVSNASSSNPEVFEVDSTLGNQVSLNGISEGNAQLSFQGLSAGERRDDSISYFVVEPTRFDMAPDCGIGNVVRGRPAAIPFTFSPDSFGRGYYPVVIDPPEAATVNMELSTATDMVIDVSETAPETFEIRVDPESGLTGDRATLTVVEEAPVESLQVDLPTRTRTESPAPQQSVEVTAVLEGGVPVCTIYPVEVSTNDASCGIWAEGMVSNSANAYWTEIAVIGLLEGTCRLEFLLQLAELIVTGAASTNVISPSPPPTSSGGGGGSDFDFD